MMKRASIIFITLILFSQLASAGFLNLLFSNHHLALTGSVVAEASQKDCIKDTVLFLRLNEPNTFAGKKIILLEVNEAGIIVDVGGVTGTIVNAGQATINGIMIILGDVFKREDLGNTLVLLKVRSETSACPNQEPQKTAGSRQCTLKFNGTRGDTAFVGGKKFRLIDLYKTGALVDIDGVPARIPNGDLRTINDVTLIVYKNNVEKADIYLVNEYCCSVGLGQAMNDATRFNALVQPQKQPAVKKEVAESGVISALLKFLV